MTRAESQVEIPTWAGSGMEQEWRADAHQFDQVPSADEESRNTLEVIGGRGEA